MFSHCTVTYLHQFCSQGSVLHSSRQAKKKSLIKLKKCDGAPVISVLPVPVVIF